MALESDWKLQGLTRHAPPRYRHDEASAEERWWRTRGASGLDADITCSMILDFSSLMCHALFLVYHRSLCYTRTSVGVLHGHPKSHLRGLTSRSPWSGCPGGHNSWDRVPSGDFRLRPHVHVPLILQGVEGSRPGVGETARPQHGHRKDGHRDRNRMREGGELDTP